MNTIFNLMKESSKTKSVEQKLMFQGFTSEVKNLIIQIYASEIDFVTDSNLNKSNMSEESGRNSLDPLSAFKSKDRNSLSYSNFSNGTSRSRKRTNEDHDTDAVFLNHYLN